jgi:exosortase A
MLTLGLTALVLVCWREWGEMLHQWWNIDTYNHILLLPPIIAWLVWLKAEALARMSPRAFGPGLGLVAAGLALWLTGRITDINLVAHAGAVGAVQGAVVAMLGLRVCALLALPIALGAFLVPFGDEIIPFLQAITADMAIALTLWSGIPATIEGIYIDTPAGLFIVAEECSGVKFLIAMVTLAAIVCFTRFRSWNRRALFMAASIIVPVLANGVRAWGTIYIAQFAGVEFAAGFDHIFYGWIFFAIVVIVVLAGAWRFFESEPEEYGPSAEWVGRSALISRHEGTGTSLRAVLAGIAALSLLAALAATL